MLLFCFGFFHRSPSIRHWILGNMISQCLEKCVSRLMTRPVKKDMTSCWARTVVSVTFVVLVVIVGFSNEAQVDGRFMIVLVCNQQLFKQPIEGREIGEASAVRIDIKL